MSKPKFLPGDLAEDNGKNVTVTASADFQLCDDCEVLLSSSSRRLRPARQRFLPRVFPQDESQR